MKTSLITLYVIELLAIELISLRKLRSRGGKISENFDYNRKKKAILVTDYYINLLN